MAAATAPTAPVSGSAGYVRARESLRTYFDATARDQWATLTSDARVSRIRATVRAGRDRMRGQLMDWLPADMAGATLLDAGCGTGALAVEAAGRGARVVAVDIAAGLVSVAKERAPAGATIDWQVGDMTAPDHGRFDHAVFMDSLIHYRAHEIAEAIAAVAPRVSASIAFTIAPRTPVLAAMHAIGALVPKGDHSPAIVPVAPERMIALLEAAAPEFIAARQARVASGFYHSHAIELVRKVPG